MPPEDEMSKAGPPNVEPLWRRLWPFAALIALLTLAGLSDLRQLASLEGLRANREILADWALANPLAARAAFVGGVAAAMAIGFPIVFVMSFAGGLFFGTWLGAALTLIGATAGGLVFFLAARRARAAAFSSRRLRAALTWIEQGFRGDELLSLMTLRLIPVFPTSAVTLAAAAAHMRVRDFIIATLLGGAPATLIYAALGSGASALIEGDASMQSVLLRPHFIVPLLGLAGLTVLAIWLRRRARR